MSDHVNRRLLGTCEVVMNTAYDEAFHIDFESALEEVVQEILIATWEIDENGVGKPWTQVR